MLGIIRKPRYKCEGLNNSENPSGETSGTGHGFDSQVISACSFSPSARTASHGVAAHDATMPKIPAWKTRFPALLFGACDLP
jgi:hypothetical protein